MRFASYYLTGCDVLGADYGPLSPEDLSKLDRKLTPAEQKAVDDWQSGLATRAQAVEEQKGGPTATISVMPRGATLTSARTRPPIWPLFIVAGIGVVGLGATVALLTKAKWGWALANFFILTPLAVTGSAVAATALTGRKL